MMMMMMRHARNQRMAKEAHQNMQSQLTRIYSRTLHTHAACSFATAHIERILIYACEHSTYWYGSPFSASACKKYEYRRNALRSACQPYNVSTITSASMCVCLWWVHILLHIYNLKEKDEQAHIESASLQALQRMKLSYLTWQILWIKDEKRITVWHSVCISRLCFCCVLYIYTASYTTHMSPSHPSTHMGWAARLYSACVYDFLNWFLRLFHFTACVRRHTHKCYKVSKVRG